MSDVSVTPIQQIYEGLAAKNPQLKEMGFDAFANDMKDENKLKTVYEGLATKNPQLKDTGFDQFKTDMWGVEVQEQPEISATESLHSSLPYFNVDKRQVVPSIPAAGENVSFDESAAPKIGEEKFMQEVVPQQKTSEEQYYNQGIEATGGAQLNSYQPEESFFFSSPEEEKLDLAQNILDRSKRQVDAVTGQGDNTGVGDALRDRNFWTLGSSDLSSMIYLKRISNKMEDGTPLTEGDKALLEAWNQSEQINQKYPASDANIWYKTGKNITDMIPWLVQFAATRGAGATARRGMELTLRENAEKYLGKTIASGLSKGAAEMAGAYAAAAFMPNTYADITRRTLGQTYADEQGNIKFDISEADSNAKAIYKGWTNGMLEVLTERLGEGIGGALVKKWPKSKLVKFIAGEGGLNATTNLSKFTKSVGWDGAPMEYFEEFVNIPLNALLVGDSKYSDVFDGKQQLETLMTVVAMGQAMKAVNATQNKMASFQAERDYKSAKSLFDSNIDEQTRNTVESILNSNASLDDQSQQLHNILTGLDGEQAGIIMNYVVRSMKAGSQQQSQPASADSAPQFTVNPRDTYAAEVRQTIEPFAHQETGSLTTVQEVTSPDQPNKLWFVKVGSQNDIDGSVLVEDEQGNQKFLTKDQIARDPEEMSIDDFIGLKLNDFDATQQAQQQAQNNQMVYDGKTLTRTGQPAQTGEGELWIDENGEAVEVPNAIVSQWEHQKQGNPVGTPEIVTRVYGKTQISGTRDQNGNILLSEPSNADQAESLRKEVEKATGGKSTVQAELIPNEDTTLPDSYQLSIIPAQNNIDTSIEKETENNQIDTTPPSQDNNVSAEQPKAIYKLNGQDIDKVTAKARVKAAILKGNKDKLAGLEIENDPELSGMIEKAFPKPKAKFSIGKKTITPEDAMDWIIAADTFDELNELKAENIESEPAIAEAFLTKVKQFTPTQIENSVNNSDQQSENISENKNQIPEKQNVENIDHQNNSQNNQLSNEESENVDRQVSGTAQQTENTTQEEQVQGEIPGKAEGKLTPLEKENPDRLKFHTSDKPFIQGTINELQSIAPNAAPVVIVNSLDQLPEEVTSHPDFRPNLTEGFYYNGKVYVFPEMIQSRDHLITLWIHENGLHNGIRNIIPYRDMRLFMNKVYDSFYEIAKNNPEFQKIIDRVNRDYRNFTKQAKAEEFLAYLSEKVVSEEDLTPIEQSMWQKYLDMFRDFLRRLFNFNPNLLTEKQIIEITRFAVQSNFQTNEYADSNQGASGNIRSRTSDNASGSERGTGTSIKLQDETSAGLSHGGRRGRVLLGNGEGLTISDRASEDLKSRHNALDAITRIGTELNIPIHVVNSLELTSDNNQLVFTDNGTVTIVSDRVKSVSEVIKALVKEVATTEGLREMLANSDPNSIIGKQLAKFDELPDGKIEPEKVAQIIRKAFRLTSGQFTNEDLIDAVVNQKSDVSGNVQFRVSDNPEENNLIAVHNIKPAGLLNANRLGGLPMPSIAIVDVNNGFDKYGDITLVADKDFVDPKKNRYSKVFAADVYSARYPNINYQIPRSGENKIANKVNSLFEDKSLASDISHHIKSEIEDGGLRSLSRDQYAQLLFLADTKRPVEIKYSESKVSDDIKQAFKDNGWLGLMYHEIHENNEVKKQLTDLYMKKYESDPDLMEVAKERFVDEDGTLNSNLMRNFIRDVQDDIQKTGKVDTYATVRAADEYIRNNNLQDEFEAYAANLYDQIGVEEKIFRGYSNSGNRLYSPHTLENVLKEMKKDGIRGGEKFGYGAGSVRAMVTPEFKSLPEIQKNRGRILPFEDDIKSTANDELIEVMDGLKKFYKYESGSFGYYDNASDELVQLARYGRSESFKPLDEESRKMVADFLNKLANLPTEYFEAKINRGVSLAEFKNALIPSNTSPEIRDILKFNGINAVEYKDNADRAEKLKELADEKELRFRIIGEAGAANLDKAEEATTRLDNLAIAREMEQAGKDVKSIRLATGWEKSGDGKWRYEVPDSELSENYQEAETLEQAVNDPELFKAYPQLKEIEIGALSAEEDENSGSFNPNGIDGKPTIYAGATDEVNLKSVLAHEIQHAIQDIEGFARGGNTEMLKSVRQSNNALISKLHEIDNIVGFDNWIKNHVDFARQLNFDIDELRRRFANTLSEATKMAYIKKVDQAKQILEENFKNAGLSDGSFGISDNEYYQRLAGEVESRNVQSRMNMTPEERRNTLLQETEDVAREDQIVLMDGLGVSNMEGENIHQAIIDQLESTAHVKDQVIIDDNEGLALQLAGKIPQRYLDEIRTEGKNIAGFEVFGKIYINNIIDPDEVVETWIHEKTHRQIKRLIPDKTRRDEVLQRVFDAVGEEEINNFLHPAYRLEDEPTRANEYLAFKVQELAETGDVDAIPEIKKVIFDLFNQITTHKNIQDAKNAINLAQQRSGKRNAHDGLRGRSGIEPNTGNTKGETPSFSRSLRQDEVGERPEESRIADLALKAKNNPSAFSEYLSESKKAVSEKKTQPENTILIDGKLRSTVNSKGLPIAQTEEGIRNFWKWFGDSKVVDKQGRPLVVYHGTNADFNEFKEKNKKSVAGEGYYFTQIPEYAKSHGNNLISVYIKSENPSIVIDWKGEDIDSINKNKKDAIFYQDGIINSLVVRNSNQIKSATGNNGSFDPENNNILFKKTIPLGDYLGTAAQQYKEGKAQRRELKTVLEGVRQFYQDHDLPIRRMEEEVKKLGGRILDSMKPYRDLNLSYGRMEELFKSFVSDRMKPILKTITEISKTGMDREAVLPYVICKRATELNPKMREKELQRFIEENPEATDAEIQEKEQEIANKDYAGVRGFDPDNNFENPDELAQTISDEFESLVPKELVDQLWTNIKYATTDIVKSWEKAKMITPEQAEEMIIGSKYYVPLRGWREGAAKQLAYVKGEGFSRSMQHAEGRKSLADNPLAYIYKVAFQAIGEQTDTEVKKSLLNLVAGNYGPEFKHMYELKKAYYVKTTLDDGSEGWQLSVDPATGEIVRPSEDMFKNGEATTKIYNQYERLRTPSQAREHEVVVKTSTGDMVIVFKDKYLPVAQAMNKKNRIYVNLFTGSINNDADFWNKPLGATIGVLNNIIKANLTSRNIVFPFTNILRDAPEASLTAYIKGESGLNVVGNMSHASAAFARDLAGKTSENNKYDQYLKEFREAGGTTGYSHMKDIDQINKEFEKELRRMTRSGFARTANLWHKAGSAINTWSDMFETTTRLAVFISSREAGKTVRDAAYDAKEYSVNFNRKGKITKALDAVYAFFNVSVQSLQKNGSLAKNYPKRFSIVAGSFMMLGFLEALLNDWYTPDDDDDDYYNVNEYVRDNYLVLPTFFWNDKYVRLPLPQFWRSFKSFGSIIYDTLVKERMTAGQATMKAMGNFIASLTPIDLGGLYVDGHVNLSPIAPSVVRPFAEVSANRDYMGNTIAKEPFTKEQEKLLADSSLGKSNVNPAIKFFTDYLAKTGGKDGETRFYRKDGETKELNPAKYWNPSKINHIVQGYLGGTYKFASDVITTASQVIDNDKEFDFNNVPFVNSFIRKTPAAKWRIIEEYYNLKDNAGYISFDALKREKLNDRNLGAYKEIATDNYLNEYQTVLDAYDNLLSEKMKYMDYKTAEGSEEVIGTMKDAISEIRKIKQKYNKK